MRRRDFLHTLAGSSVTLLIPAHLSAQVLKPGNNVALKCLGNVNGPRWLDGRTGNATVGLAPDLNKKFTGTKWSIVRAGEGIIALKCQGVVDGPRWLDGRTGNGTVGLAPRTDPPFTGTKWEVQVYPGIFD